jgi:hypothetical protein
VAGADRLGLVDRAGFALAWMGLTFGGLAAISFGGAYAALAYLGQTASTFGWLSATQMLDGLGLAETTPGPLILVFVFVGFVGAFQTAPPEWAWVLGRAGRADGRLDHLRALVPVDLRRRAAVRAMGPPAQARAGPGPDLGGRGRRDRPTGPVVRHPPAVPQRPDDGGGGPVRVMLPDLASLDSPPWA